MGEVRWPKAPAGATVIIGVGNLLLQDEGVGIHAIQELQRRALPPEVEVVDGGVAGMRLLDFLQGAARVLLIDAADMNLPPGTVFRFTPEEVRAGAKEVRFSTHDLGLLEVLELAKALGQCPEEVIIIGVQPKEIAWGTELTPEVQAAVPKVIEAVLREIDPKREQKA